MTLSVQSYPKFRSIIPSTNEPNNGGYVWTYSTGTTDLLATYADADGDTVNENPIHLDSNGEAFIWILNTDDAAYDFVIEDSNHEIIQTILNVQQVAIVNNNVTFSGNLPIDNNSIIDSNTKKYIKFTSTSSAINYFTVINSAIGVGPTIGVDGTDTNIDNKITAKGTGKVTLSGIKYPNADGTNGQSLRTNGSGVLSFFTPSSGTVTSVATGTGLTGGPITTTGTISLANTAVSAGSYTYSAITVDAQGRLTAASSGTAPVTSVTGTASNISSSGGSTPVINLIDTAVTPGSYTLANITIDQKGRITAAASGSGGTGTVTSVATGTGLTGGPITTTGTVSLANTAVTPASYTHSSITVDQQGRITAASSGTSPVTSVTGTAARISSSGGTTPVLDLITTSVSAASYTNADITVDAYGRLTAASNGSAGVGSGSNANMLINGSHNIWQENTTYSINNTNTYAADGYQGKAGVVAATYSQQADATSGSFVSRIQRDNGTSGTGIITYGQTLTRDMCHGMAGNKVTFSFRAKSGANFSPTSGNITILIESGTGTTDISNISSTFSGINTEYNATQAITSTMTRYSATTTSALGATVTQLSVKITFTPTGTAGVADFLDTNDWKVEISTAATAFQSRPFSQDLLDCQRFYSKSFLYSTVPAQNVGITKGEEGFTAHKAGATFQQSHFIHYPTIMRALPTITTYSPAASSAQYYDLDAAAACTSVNIGRKSDRGFVGGCTTNAGTAIGNLIAVNWTADARLA